MCTFGRTHDQKTQKIGKLNIHGNALTGDFQGQTGSGQTVPLTDDSGLFYFFSYDNIEILAKVLDGCSINGFYWFFAAATTNVEYTLTVVDTQNGTTRTWTNPLGVSSRAITATDAFQTCP